MEQQETIYAMALTRISNFNFQTALQLYREMGSAQAIYDHRNDIQDILPECSPRLLHAIRSWDDALHRAEAELEFASRHHIRILTPADDDYPCRLNECVDAPLVLYYRGYADLNTQHILAIVGTRQCTSYGQDLIRQFVKELAEQVPDTLIVSGLAYGVDIHAHRRALEHGLPTIGVLAHGLDQLYPAHHRETARQMLQQGGLLTEFMSQTNADKPNFVRRNRIVAGMADATLLVESAFKGGGLITARIANSYNRDVFAFPGAVGATYSEGCNQLIRNKEAELITRAEELVQAMGWENAAALEQAKRHGIEREIFPELSDEEQRITTLLLNNGDLPLNTISIQSGIPIQHTNALLFQLEMKGVIRLLAGGIYHLIR